MSYVSRFYRIVAPDTESKSDRTAHIPPTKTLKGRKMTVKFATINAKREMGTGGLLWLTIQAIIPHSKSRTDAVNIDNIATPCLWCSRTTIAPLTAAAA